MKIYFWTTRKEYVVKGLGGFMMRYTVLILASTSTTYLILILLFFMQRFWVPIILHFGSLDAIQSNLFLKANEDRDGFDSMATY